MSKLIKVLSFLLLVSLNYQAKAEALGSKQATDKINQLLDFSTPNLLELVELIPFSYVMPSNSILFLKRRIITLFGYTCIPFFYDDSSRQAGIVIVNPKKQVKLIFRGTRHFDETAISIKTLWQSSDIMKGSFHKGYYHRFERLLPVVMRILTNLAEKLGDGDINKLDLLISGHSMGGAIAMIMAKYLAEAKAINSIKVITFATPRFMDSEAAKHYDSLLKDKTLRIVQDFYDPVPKIGPLLFGGYHAGHEILINKLPGDLTHAFYSYANTMRTWGSGKSESS